MNVKANDILVVALITVLAVIGAIALPSAGLRVIAGLLLVCYLPGYAILRAVDAEWRSDLAGIVFAAGLSIAVTVGCGLVLNLVGPLTPARWTIALAIVTLAACGIAFVRNHPLSGTPRAAIGVPALRAGQAVMLACAGLIVVATVMWTRHDLLAHPQFAYTELWMAPAARGGAFTVGIRNVERSPSSYDVELVLDGRIVAVRRSIALRVGESWTSDFAMPTRDDDPHMAEARLYRRGQDRLVYRRVWLKTEAREP